MKSKDNPQNHLAFTLEDTSFFMALALARKDLTVPELDAIEARLTARIYQAASDQMLTVKCIRFYCERFRVEVEASAECWS